ncbi:hypothetical protein GBAR_LOCUS5925, partial [Geodia barretti]
ITRGGGSAVSLSLFDSVQAPLPSWLCPPEFRLGNGVGPFAHSFETAAERRDEFIIQASQQLDGYILQAPPEQDTATGALSPRR